MRALLRKIILWALQREDPPYDPATLDKIAAENKN
jgi:hypothetical protein